MIDDNLLLGFWIAMTLAAVASTSGCLSAITLHGKMASESSMWHVPKYWFYHFYLFGIGINWAVHGLESNPFLIVHLTRRLVEQLWLFPYSKESKMHVLAYLVGYVFYTAVTFTVTNANPMFWLWLIGNVIQFYSHRALYMHRLFGPKDAKRSPPLNIFFHFMYCPHYFAEMLIYISFASSSQASSNACAVFVCISLAINWKNQSSWYINNSK